MRLRTALSMVFLAATGASAQNLFPAEFDLRDLLSVNGGDGSIGFVINVAGEPSGLGHLIRLTLIWMVFTTGMITSNLRPTD